MDRLLKAVLQFKEFTFHTDDDLCDRMSRQVSPALLCLFTVLVSVKQYVGDPINCWCPAQFTSSHQEYTNTVCWVSDTYYVPFEQDMPKAQEPRQMISYYQWVPLILLAQAALFFTPYVIWHFLNRRSGINLGSVIEAAVTCQHILSTETREKTLRFMVSQVDGFLLTNRSYGTGWLARCKAVLGQHCLLCCSRLSGNYLVGVYLLVKLLYITNAIGQLFLLDVFLGMRMDYHVYGLRVLRRMVSGKDWSSSERFPRVTLCDFEIRQQTNVHRYTVQCVLPINLFNEKIFVFLWFWLLLMAALTTFSFVHWCSKCLLLPLQLAYIKRQLRALELSQREVKATRAFTQTYLRRDGVLILRLIGKNAGDIVAAELLHGLWTNYGPQRRLLGEANTSSGKDSRKAPRNRHVCGTGDIV